MRLSRKEEIQKRRKDVFFAFYMEEMSVDLISYLTGYSCKTIEKDLEEIQKKEQEYYTELFNS